MRTWFRFLAGMVPFALSAAVWTWAFLPSPTLRIWFLDVGQGDSTVVLTPSGRVLVVDAGGVSPEDDAGRQAVLPFLRSIGVSRIDALLITHADADHAGGAPSVADRMAVVHILVPDSRQKGERYDTLLAASRGRNQIVRRLARGEHIDCGDGVVVEVLHPTAGSRASDNAGSLVARVKYGMTSVLLPGDIDADTEAAVAAMGSARADVLKLSHHGSGGATSDAFLDRVAPRAAVVSCGRRNRFGHPHSEVLDRLARRHIPVFRTDQHGAICAESDGRTLRLSTTLR